MLLVSKPVENFRMHVFLILFLWLHSYKEFCHIPGVVPLSFHVDGAEFFRDAEYNVWSMSSILSSGDVPRSILV